MSAGALPSRRDVLTARTGEASNEAHVSSLVLHVRPENLTDVRAALDSMPGVEVPAEAGGKLIVTLETSSEGQIVARMNGISALPGVLSAALVFHHVETEPIDASISDQE
jgi:periplasmic nitrate reductase NapD